jgi:hypothetical protein
VVVQFKPEEITGIMKDFDEPGHLAPTGMFVAGAKYMVIQGEPGAVIRGKKVRNCFASLEFPNLYYMLSLIDRSFLFVMLINLPLIRSVGSRRHNHQEDRAGAGRRHLRRAHDPWAVQHGGGEAWRLPR